MKTNETTEDGAEASLMTSGVNSRIQLLAHNSSTPKTSKNLMKSSSADSKTKALTIGKNGSTGQASIPEHSIGTSTPNYTGPLRADDAEDSEDSSAEVEGKLLDIFEQSLVIAWLKTDEGYQWTRDNFEQCGNFGVLLSTKLDCSSIYFDDPNEWWIWWMD